MPQKNGSFIIYSVLIYLLESISIIALLPFQRLQVPEAAQRPRPRPLRRHIFTFPATVFSCADMHRHEVKLALMNIYQLTTTSNTLSQSISEFERVHKDMKEGGARGTPHPTAPFRTHRCMRVPSSDLGSEREDALTSPLDYEPNPCPHDLSVFPMFTRL